MRVKNKDNTNLVPVNSIAVGKGFIWENMHYVVVKDCLSITEFKSIPVIEIENACLTKFPDGTTLVEPCAFEISVE